MALQHASLELQTKLVNPHIPGKKKKAIEIIILVWGKL